MNVCFIAHSSNLYGAERSLLELIEVLQRRGVHSRVVLPSRGPFCAKLRERGVEYAVIPFRSWMSRPSPAWKRVLRIASIPISALVVARQIRRWRCDIVYTNTISVCEGALAAWLVGCPHVWHIHEFEYRDHDLVFHLGERLSLGLVARLSSVCMACSRAVARKYAPYIPAPKLRMIYPSVTVAPAPATQDPLSHPGTPELIRCVLVGSLVKGKRQEDAIRAIAEIVRAGLAAELVLVGDGDPGYVRYLRALVHQEAVDQQVTFTGYIENPQALMRNAAIVLLCSKSEAFPRVTIEGMLLGKPVIGTASGGTEEQICDGFNGFLYSPGDARALAQRIQYLHQHPEKAREMGRNGQQWALEKFGQERYGAEILALLQQLANPSRTMPRRVSEL